MVRWPVAQLASNRLHSAHSDAVRWIPCLDHLIRINAPAETSPGFVWRLQFETGNATELQHGFGADVIANTSVWKSVEDLNYYIYRTAHAQIMNRRKPWFHRMSDAYKVLWWIPEGYRSGLGEARLKLELLKAHGPGPDALTFKNCYPDPSELQETDIREFDDECPAF